MARICFAFWVVASIGGFSGGISVGFFEFPQICYTSSLFVCFVNGKSCNAATRMYRHWQVDITNKLWMLLSRGQLLMRTKCPATWAAISERRFLLSSAYCKTWNLNYAQVEASKATDTPKHPTTDHKRAQIESPLMFSAERLFWWVSK